MTATYDDIGEIESVSVLVDGARLEGPQLLDLALAVQRAGTERGLRFQRLETSRVRGSGSRYLFLLDAAERCWIVAVTNHERRSSDAAKVRAAERHPTPHVVLVAGDAGEALRLVKPILSEIAAGTRPWYDPDVTRRGHGGGRS